MTDAQLQAVRRHFMAYANGYLAQAGAMRPMMELKREHCAFVARNCKELATVNGWPAQDVNTAEALGFLHDIGRFPQLEEFGTFLDAKSIDHGERGWQAIRESGLLDEVEPQLRDALLDGVRHHNGRTIPEGLPENHYRWIKLIRDADRLDIYRVVYDAIVNEELEAHPEIGLGLRLEGDPCPELIERILQGDPPAYTDLKTFSDFLLLILSWVGQMGYPATLQIMRERGIVGQFAAHLPTGQPQVAAAVRMFGRTVDAA
ncbi:HD domain-containing protein [Pontiella sp.]|uniref:HD domain-containing protein n=1 Tax=Pontiella sp. TaxID=2837462 RepID=UPI0035682EB1